MQGTAMVERLRLSGRFVKGKGFTANKSPVDFVGDIKLDDRFVPVAFDAKSFAGDRWDFSEWKPGAKKHHQLKRLRDMAAFGGLAFALVRQSRLSTVSGTTVDARTGKTPNGTATTPYRYYDYPAWLVPLPLIESVATTDTWSMSESYLRAYAVPISGANWLEAARNLVQ